MNVYHCCAHKTGSHWITAILSDPWLRNHASQKMDYIYLPSLPDYPKFHAFDWSIYTHKWDNIFPDNVVLSPLYIGWNSFINLPKPHDYKAFFVIRHPKDLLISMYHSFLKNHTPNSRVLEFREHVQNMTHEQIYAQLIVNRNELFCVLADWWANKDVNKNVMVIKFEDLIGEQQSQTFTQLFNHCGFNIEEPVVAQFLSGYTLENMRIMSGNPKHYRKGVAGSWVDDWNNEIETIWQQNEFFQSAHFKALPYQNI